MEGDRKVITLRVAPDIKFQIEKAAFEEEYSTVNAWLIKVITEYLDKKNREHRI